MNPYSAVCFDDENIGHASRKQKTHSDEGRNTDNRKHVFRKEDNRNRLNFAKKLKKRNDTRESANERTRNVMLIFAERKDSGNDSARALFSAFLLASESWSQERSSAIRLLPGLGWSFNSDERENLS
jgi:hypothetical protein